MELFNKLINADISVGEEKYRMDIIKEYFSPYAKEISADALGNITVTTKGEKTCDTAFFVCYDAVGLIVNYISQNGNIKVTPLGKFDFSDAEKINVKKGKYIGSIKKTNDEAKDFTEAFAHFGFESEASARRAGFSEGDILTFSVGNTISDDGFVSGFSVGNAAVIKAFFDAAKETENISVKFVFVTQSVLGQRGAVPAAYNIGENNAIFFDLCERDSLALKMLDKTFVANADVSERIFASNHNNIPLVRYTDNENISDAGRIASAYCGKRVACISLPYTKQGSLIQKVNIKDICLLSGLLSDYIKENNK